MDKEVCTSIVVVKGDRRGNSVYDCRVGWFCLYVPVLFVCVAVMACEFGGLCVVSCLFDSFFCFFFAASLRQCVWCKLGMRDDGGSTRIVTVLDGIRIGGWWECEWIPV